MSKHFSDEELYDAFNKLALNCKGAFERGTCEGCLFDLGCEEPCLLYTSIPTRWCVDLKDRIRVRRNQGKKRQRRKHDGLAKRDRVLSSLKCALDTLKKSV